LVLVREHETSVYPIGKALRTIVVRTSEFFFFKEQNFVKEKVKNLLEFPGIYLLSFNMGSSK